jgi:molybdopterin molybdotransferase
MMPFDAAQTAILAAAATRPSELIALADAAGRVVAHDIIAGEDLVPFARSAMDGFAVLAADLAILPRTLPLGATVFAAAGSQQHRPGTATAIATGAAIPAGADSVIPVEHVVVGPGRVTFTRPALPGAHIFPPGDDALRGDVLLPRGTLVTPAGLGLLAAAGHSRVAVHHRPRIAVICSGDELVGIDERPGHGQVRDSNGLMLAAALTAAGAIVAQSYRLPDDPAAIRQAIAGACDDVDLVVTTGGASVGEHDFIKTACAEIGVSFLFRSVALRPAKPTAVGLRGDVLVAVLPGNPAAAFVALHELVAPAVRAMCGLRSPRPARVSARLDGTIRAKPARHFAAFAAAASGPDGFIVTPLDNQCSSLTRTAVDAAGLIVVPPGSRTYGPGDRVEVDIIDWSRIGIPTSKGTLALV